MNSMGKSVSPPKRYGAYAGLATLLLVIFGGFFLYPLLTADGIKGDVIDCAVVKQKNGANRLWILTDGSLSYISSTKTPGHYSVGRKCVSCKAWLYEYDPVGGKIVRKIKIPYDDVIMNANLFCDGDTICQVSDAYHKNVPKILNYDVNTGTLVGDTASFTSRHPELAAGIVKVRYDKEKDTLLLDTKDGKKDLTYSLQEKKFYPSFPKYLEEKRKDSSDAQMFILCEENGQDTRKLLYSVWGKRCDILWNKSRLEANCEESMRHLSRHYEGLGVKRLNNSIFLRGSIYQQDRDGVIIISVNQVDRKADRILTCVDREGKIKWKVPQNEMFEEMKIDEDRGYHSGFDGSSNKIKVLRSGNLVVLMLEGVGVMGFDYATGKKQFTLD
ncbi:MAG: hypothetical protein A4E66_00720 [Syntrophus sp. PtaB.Bin001]|nr:MAG: hypothetical protein A4E66_00720 [Syntrophus sp. PtaB.Bin001]